MKSLAMFLILSLSINAFAQEVVREFDPAEETVCHKEFKAVGCVSKDGLEDLKCIENKLDKVSSPCRLMHSEKKKQKK